MTTIDEKAMEAAARALCIAQGDNPDRDWRDQGGVTLSVAIHPEDAPLWKHRRRVTEAAIRAYLTTTPPWEASGFGDGIEAAAKIAVDRQEELQERRRASTVDYGSRLAARQDEAVIIELRIRALRPAPVVKGDAVAKRGNCARAAATTSAKNAPSYAVQERSDDE